MCIKWTGNAVRVMPRLVQTCLHMLQPFLHQTVGGVRPQPNKQTLTASGFNEQVNIKN